ncbi:MAG TPA: pitrilysin family protein, partial [Pyrinomonadaceae bacterium]|nr:pitrilysin family protein [Pyrinomonadaceae bacterium]
YRPDNAALIVVGDFDQKQLDAWVDKYFGNIERPKTPIRRVNIVEPERAKEMRFVKTAPNVPLPALAITYHAPPAKSPDVPALEVAQTILSSGESSRLYESLIRSQQIASDANFYADIRQDKGLLILYAIASEGKNLEDIEKSLLAEITKMQNSPVSARELEKAKNKMITNILRERETNVGKANAIGRAVIFQDNANTVNTDIQKLQAVTAADVQRVMKKYFRDNNRVVIYYKNEEAKEEAK